MADNTATTLKMARLLALGHIVVGVLLFIFGIVDRVHGYFWSGEGCFGIWCGIWMCITGALGIPASNRERNSSSDAFAGAFMGFAITSSVFGGIIIICYSISIASHNYWYYGWRGYYYGSFRTEMAITAIILILGIVEFIIGIWAAVVCCSITNCNCCATPSGQGTSVVYVAGQGVVSGGYVMGQGPGGVPVAYPMQQAGGVVTVPGTQPQMVYMPAGQPPMYQVPTVQTQMVQVPTSGAAVAQPQMAHVPPSGAEGGQPQMVQGTPLSQGVTPQFVRVTPDGPVTGGQGTQQAQMPPPYNPDEGLPVKT